MVNINGVIALSVLSHWQGSLVNVLVVNESIVLSFVVVNCGDPGTPANGVRYGDVFTYKSKILLECDPQYKLAGDLTRTCQADGSWTGSQPTCQGKQKDQL